jgi:hypothetical protein
VAYESKERSLGEILDGAFQLYRSHFRVFLGVALCLALPTVVLVTAVNWLLTGHADTAAAFEAIGSRRLEPSDRSRSLMDVLGPSLRALLATLLTVPLTVLVQVIQDAALTTAVSDAYLGQPVSAQSAFRAAFARLQSLTFATFIKGIATALGFLCLIVPGVLLTIRWMFSTQAIMIEKHHTSRALGRSRDLAKDDYGRLFLLFLVLAVIGIGIHFGLRALVPKAVAGIPLLGQLLQLIPQLLVAPIGSAAITLAYFDLRVKKEGFDLERLALALGQPVSAAPLQG